MIRRRQVLAAGGAATLAAAGLARPAIAAASKTTLRFVPQAALANPDPIWTTATVAINHGYMIYDTLYGIDNAWVAKPQMCAGHELSSDELTWTFTLRDGLLWHDNTPVRAIDCVTSIHRWSEKDPFGQQLALQMNEMKAVDDKRFQIRLKKPFRQMLYALGAEQCFIMPERVAKTPATTQIKEYIGSGPFVFLVKEWVSGATSAYKKFDKYVPRQEKPEYLSGGKVVHFDRVEWVVEPDPATAAAALQTGEVDYVEFPLIDLLPTLRQAPGCAVETFDPLGALAIIAFNHLYPPFDNQKVREALLPAIDQKEFVTAWVGEQASLGKYPVGFFTAGAPMANTVGLDAFTSRRDPAKTKKLLQEAGYKGEKVILMSPSDQPSIQALAQVTRSVFQNVGINVEYQSMDWGTLVSRRALMKPPGQGGWHVFCTTWGGRATSNPGSSYPLRCNGKKGWFGWPTDTKIEALRQQWFDTADLAAQKKICEQIQARAFEVIPFMPVGQWYYPVAHRTDLTDFVKNAQIVFWGVRQA